MDAADPPQRFESEMSQHQRNLVDLCLEEGQYEAAIEALAQLRSPHHKPSAAHIRQLLFMALYSPSDTRVHVDLSASPSKRQKKSYLLPSPAASLASQQLLVSFAITNTPAAVIRALRPTDAAPEDDNECFVATESLCISRCKSCWQVLVDGFLNHQQIYGAAPSRKGKRRDTGGHGSFGDLSTMSDLRAPVGDTAWPVLEWLLLIFERDEDESGVSPRHSPLLLEQLGMPSRRDTDAPLAVIVYCYEQSDPRRRIFGSRLLNLLINLSSTTHLDFPLLVASVFNRLSSSSLDDIPSLLANLKQSAAVSKFKIAVYQKYFNDSTGTATQVSVRPRPQARAQTKGSPVKARNAAQPVSLANKYRAPCSADVLRLVEGTTTTPASLGLKIKFELLVSYNAFQMEAPPAERDQEWAELLHNGIITKTLDAAFGRKGGAGESGPYRDLLDIVLNLADHEAGF
ncbi:hypothetical protein GGX14DRAFT_597979 [Mycena pura]|uniref:Uncharacterized protein n=1 Tax=Mycena pura TaxID=153505 RepID=A0AAD6VMV0_9AGAR|nr:hypothetical protein GGX14DRAFT_597979 [Mycena pura]